MDVDRAMHVQDAGRVRDLAVGDADRNQPAAFRNGAAKDRRLVLVDVAAENPLPDAGLFESRSCFIAPPVFSRRPLSKTLISSA